MIHEEFHWYNLPFTTAPHSWPTGLLGECSCGWKVQSEPANRRRMLVLWERHRKGLPVWDPYHYRRRDVR